MKQATLDQFFARKSKPPDDPCSKDEENPLKRKAEEPKKERRKRVKPNAAMTHAPWWDARTQQLSWVFPVDEAYANTKRTLGWIGKMEHHLPNRFPLVLSQGIALAMRRRRQNIPLDCPRCWLRMRC